MVQGNKIGTDVLGTTSLPNQLGISLHSSSSHNTIGGAQPGEGNLISGNLWDGIRLESGSGSRIQGNYIGTVISGDAPLANGQKGINVRSGASSNRIGVETDAAEGNVISGNTQEGISISGAGTNGNVVAGNWIGTDATGTSAVANGTFGIQLSGGAQANVLGTSGDGVADALEGNLISGNAITGIRITGSGTDWNVVAGNRIGTQADGNSPLGNSRSIEVISGPVSTRIGTDGDGDSDAAEANVVAGNSRASISHQQPTRSLPAT